MSKLLHVVKTADHCFQIRRTDSAGEGPGMGDHIDCKDQAELEKLLRTEGAPDQKIADTLRTLGENDNAEIRF
jgi:hypothetical protein